MIAPLAPPCGRFDGPRHSYAVRVYHEDTDASGVVYHASYLRWFERARSDILALLGVDQRAAMDAGEGYYVVSDLAVRYLAPARLGEAIMVETTCEEAGAASLRMRQIAYLDGQKLCEATVRVGFIGSGGKPQRQPQSWRDAFAAVVEKREV